MILSQNDGGFLFSMSGLTLIILFMSLAVFGWLAIRYRNIRSFEFQISIFITTYVVGEMIEDYKMPFLSAFPYIGSQIHIASACTFSHDIMAKIILCAKRREKHD